MSKTQTFVNGDAFKAGAEVMTKGYEQMIAMTKEQVEKVMPTAAKTFDEMADFGKGNVDAALKASKIAAKGWETIGKEVADYNKKALETGMANTKALFAVKNFKDAVELQAGFARAAYDDFVAQGTKLSELSIKVAQDTAEPLNARVNEAVAKASKPVAA